MQYQQKLIRPCGIARPDPEDFFLPASVFTLVMYVFRDCPVGSQIRQTLVKHYTVRCASIFSFIVPVRVVPTIKNGWNRNLRIDFTDAR